MAPPTATMIKHKKQQLRNEAQAVGHFSSQRTKQREGYTVTSALAASLCDASGLDKSTGVATRAESEKAAKTKPTASCPLSPTQAASQLFPLPPSWLRGILRVRIKHELEEGRGKRWTWHKGAVHPKNKMPEEEELKTVCERFGYRWSDDGNAEKDTVDGVPTPSRLYLMVRDGIPRIVWCWPSSH